VRLRTKTGEDAGAKLGAVVTLAANQDRATRRLGGGFRRIYGRPPGNNWLATSA
jgi:hypothetical protein